MELLCLLTNQTYQLMIISWKYEIICELQLVIKLSRNWENLVLGNNGNFFSTHFRPSLLEDFSCQEPSHVILSSLRVILIRNLKCQNHQISIVYQRDVQMKFFQTTHLLCAPTFYKLKILKLRKMIFLILSVYLKKFCQIAIPR